MFALSELDQAFEKLRARTGDFGAVVEVDLQTPDARMRRFPFRPPVFQGVGHEVGRLARCAKHDRELAADHFQNTGRSQHCVGVHVVIDGLQRFIPTAAAAA